MTWTSEHFGEAVRRVAAWDLPAAPELIVPYDASDFEPFAQRLEATRLIGPLLAAVTVGDIELPDDLHADLIGRQEAALAWCVELEVRLLEVLEWFGGDGDLACRVIKGPAIAHLDALDPSIRTFADIDLLIRADDIDQAVRILERQNATRPWSQRRRGWDRRFAKSVTMTFSDGIEFDLHRMPADGVFGHRIPLERLFESPDDFDVGGVTVHAMSSVHRLLHSAFHLLLGSAEPHLMNVRDLATYLSSERLSPELVVPEARRWGGVDVLAMAIDQVAELIEAVPPAWAVWRTDFVVDPLESRMIRRHRSEGSSFGRAKLDVLHELPGLRDRAAYATALAWPSREHLASRGLRRRDMVPLLTSRARTQLLGPGATKS